MFLQVSVQRLYPFKTARCNRSAKAVNLQNLRPAHQTSLLNWKILNGKEAKTFLRTKNRSWYKMQAISWGVNPQSAINVWATELLPSREIHKCRICSRFYSQDVFFVCKSSSLICYRNNLHSSHCRRLLRVSTRDKEGLQALQNISSACHSFWGIKSHKKSFGPLIQWVGRRDRKLFRWEMSCVPFLASCYIALDEFITFS